MTHGRLWTIPIFELKTHADGFNEESKKVAKRPRKNQLPPGAIQKGLAQAGGIAAAPGRARREDPGTTDDLMATGALEMEDRETDWPQLHLYVCLAVLVISTIILASIRSS